MKYPTTDEIVATMTKQEKFWLVKQDKKMIDKFVQVRANRIIQERERWAN